MISSTGHLEWFWPADPHLDHPVFTGPAIIDGKAFVIAKGSIDPNGPTGRVMSEDAHVVSTTDLACHAIPVFGACDEGSTEASREELVSNGIAPHIDSYFAGSNIWEGSSRVREGAQDPMGFAFGGPYGAVIKFDTGESFKYDFITFHLSFGVDRESYEETLTIGKFAHKIIHEHRYG